MQKIVLTQKTLGTIIDRLRNVTSGFYRFYETTDVNPLRCRTWGEPILSDRTAYAGITVHHVLKDRFSGFEEKFGKPGYPLIHFAFDAECGYYFSEGDTFFFKGNMVIVNSTHKTDVKIRKCQNIVTKIVCRKRSKDLTSEELEVIRNNKDIAELSVQAWEEHMSDELERQFSDDYLNVMDEQMRAIFGEGVETPEDELSY